MNDGWVRVRCDILKEVMCGYRIKVDGVALFISRPNVQEMAYGPYPKPNQMITVPRWMAEEEGWTYFE
jgi:hypothetical protein